MATSSKSKPAAAVEPAAPAAPITFAEIAHNRLAERLTAYRELVRRHASGEVLGVAEMERVADLMDLIGLPQFAFDRDAEAILRYDAVSVKHKAAIANEPAARERAVQLHGEMEEVTRKLAVLREEHRRAVAASSKGSSYAHTLAQLGSEHPHVLADLDVAVRLRAEELDRRKRATIGGAV